MFYSVTFIASGQSAEGVQKTKHVALYDGNLVVHFQDEFLSSFAVFGIIFLENQDKTNNETIQTDLAHESGHLKQEDEYGTVKYLFAVAIPSMLYNVLSRGNDANYYNMPWEYGADKRSDIQRPQHSRAAKYVNYFYEGYVRFIP